MADKRISQLIERTDIANNDVLPIVASGATTTNKVTISTIQEWMQDNLDVGVTSVGLSMPSAFVVSASPVTTSGNISVTGAGTVAQYIRGDGSLADFPSGGGGGGASVSYYLNGSVSQGTIGGVAYREMNKTPILGAGTDFNISTNGYIASFITDAGDPSLLQIPAGNWNFETFLSANNNAGNPTFYIELYKVDSGGTATLIASNSATPEPIAFGSTIHSYFSALAVPTTTLALTDRLALRYYINNSGRTITLHTENSHLCQIITTFTTGLTALNGLTAQVQNFTTGTSGTDFGISSTGSTHTFNLPTASATNRGALSSADWTTFNNKQAAGNYVTTDTNQSITGFKSFANGFSLASEGGTNQPTTFINTGSIHEGSASTNQIGFNNSNNIYFGKGLNNGGVIQWTNAAVRYYTLPDADGTIALTSDLSGYVTLGTTQTITGAKTFDTTTSTFALMNSTNANGGVLSFRRNGTNVGHIGNSAQLGGGVLDAIEVRSGVGSSVILRSDGGQVTLATGGGVTLTGALNGTSATFSGNVTSSTNTFALDNAGSRLTLKNTANTLGFDIGLLGGGGDATAYIYNRANAGLIFGTNNASQLTIASTGAATFSSSVTAGAAINLPNNFSLTGRNAANTLNISLITRNTSDRVVIDADGYGTNIGGGGSVLINPTGGNVGIGTTSPSFRLSVNRNSSGIQDVLSINNLHQTVGVLDGVRLNLRDFNIESSSTYGSSDNIFTIGIGTSKQITLLQNGNVGIGTASPATALDVYRDAFPEIRVRSASVTNTYGVDTTNNTGTLGTITNHPFAFFTNSTERMRITSGGYLKASNTGSYIGVSLLYHELITNRTEEWTTRISSSGASPYSLNLRYSNASPNNADNWFIFCEDSTTARFRVASNGNATNTNGSYGAISDIKLKENIEDATPKLDDLMKVKVRNYNLIGDDKKQIGVIAQELEDVFPAMIDESEDFEEVEVPQLDEEGNEVLNEEGEVVTEKQRVSKGTSTKSVKYSVFVPMLIKAIQELKTEIDSLKNQIK